VFRAAAAQLPAGTSIEVAGSARSGRTCIVSGRIAIAVHPLIEMIEPSHRRCAIALQDTSPAHLPKVGA
jgi:hypothetical protein